MVSTRYLFVLIAAGLASAQQTSNLLDTRSKPTTAQPSAESPVLTPEKHADIFMARKQYREAIEMYHQAPQNDPVILNKTGIGYHQLLDFNSARKWYERAIKAKPEYAEALNNLGTVFYAKKSYKRAISYYQKALKHSPNSASIYSNLGIAYFARRKYPEFLAAYQKALELDPDVFEHRSTYGVLLQERSVQDRAQFHYFMAKNYAKAGQTERALLYIRKALEEGFKDRKKFLEEPEFVNLQTVPEFQEVMAREQRVL